jgi:hypothetical protein
MENHKGRADAFSTFTPLKARFSRFLQALVYAGAPERDPQIRKEGFLHFAFWTTLRRRDLARAGVSEVDNPKHGALLFVSAFNGDPDEYIAGFSAHLHEEMDALWNESVEWAGASDPKKLDWFIARYSRSVNLFFNAYRDDLKGLRNAVTLRRRLDELADTHLAGMPQSQLRDELATLARLLEGTA